MKKVLNLVLFTTLVATLLFASSGVANASFNKNSIIGDSVFDDKGSMSAGKIDAFLNTFSQSCISTNRGFAAKQPVGYNPTNGFLYGGYVSAGTVIYSAAQAYDLNPQVLIVTLEKEQSLVSGRNDFNGYCNASSQHKYTAAMGYGCPDSGGSYSYTGISLYRRSGVVRTSSGSTCVNSKDKAGFSQQVIRAAWLLKFGQQRSLGNIDWAIIRGNWDNSDDLQSCYSGPMTRGNHQVCPSGSTVFYDGFRTIDGTKTFMGTGATASLYWYTPHFHGNENFVYFFESWFGSTIGSYLLRTTSETTVYLVTDDKKYPITNLETMKALYPLGNPKYVSSSYLSSKTTMPPLKRLIKSADSSTLYFFDSGIKLRFGSCTQIQHYGMECSDVAELSQLQIDKLTTGPNMPYVMNTTSGKWFYVQNGEKRETTGTIALTDNGLSTTHIKLTESSLASLDLGAPVVSPNSIMTSRESGNKYFYSVGNRYLVPSSLRTLSFLKNMKGGFLDAASIVKFTSVAFSGFATDGSEEYIFDNKGKVTLSISSDWSSSFTTLPSILLSAIPDSSTSTATNRVYKGSTSTIYRVIDVSRVSFPSWTDLELYSVGAPAITTLPQYYINVLDNVGTQYGPTRLVKAPDDSTVFMVDGSDNKRRVSAFSIVRATGIDFPVQSVSQSVLNQYALSAELADHRILCGSTYYLATAGVLKTIDTTMKQTYGFDDSSFVNYQNSTCSNLQKSGSFTARYIKIDSDNTIFYVQNGTKRPFVSYSRYVSHGGTKSNTVMLEKTLASTIPTGQTL